MKQLILIAITIALFTSCKEEKVRTYTEKQNTVAPQKMHGASPHAKVSPKFDWTLPEGWVAKDGGGMISTTFSSATEPEKFKATLVILSGAAGGVDANLTRWLGQLGLPASEGDLLKIKTKAVALKTKSFEGSVYDLTLDPKQQKTFVVAIIPVDGYNVFVKFISDVPTAEQNKEKFMSLLKSLEYKSNAH